MNFRYFDQIAKQNRLFFKRGQGSNGSGFAIARDFITQSQFYEAVTQTFFFFCGVLMDINSLKLNPPDPQRHL